MINIGHFMPQYGTITGTGQVLEKLCGLLNEVNNIRLFIYKYGEENDIYINDKITVISFKPNQSKLWPIPLDIIQELKNNKYELDSLGLHMPFTLHNLIISSISKIPIYYYPHGCFNPKTLYRKGKKFKKLIYYWLIERWILDSSNKIICATEKEQIYLKQLGFNKTHIAHFPFSLPSPSKKHNFEKSFREKYNFKDDDFLIFFVGRWDIYTKGLDILIKTTKSLNSQNNRIKTILIGYDVNKKKVSDYIAETDSQNCVYPIGEIYGEKKLEALLSANVYVQPSRYESFGVSILEALSLKVPCLLSTGCDLTHTIVQNDGCIQFKPEEKSLQKAILKAVNNPQKLEVIAERGKEWVDIALSKNNMLVQWKKIYFP